MLKKNSIHKFIPIFQKLRIKCINLYFIILLYYIILHNVHKNKYSIHKLRELAKIYSCVSKFKNSMNFLILGCFDLILKQT